MSKKDMVYFNGLDITTGKYVTPPIPVEAFAAFVQKQIQQAQAPQTPEARAPEGVAGVMPAMPAPAAGPAFEAEKAEKLEEAGWGVIFAPNTKPEIVAALRPLLDRRKGQAGSRYKKYTWRKGETADQFLCRNGVTPGQVDPDQVPYYLLIVADPVAISYDCQFDLDVKRAVGRIYFKTRKEYQNYARAVVAAEKAAETGASTVPRRAVVFAPAMDPDTKGSRTYLAIPLARMLRAKHPAWKVNAITGAAATKARLGQVLCGTDSADPAALVFTASHGGATPSGNGSQLKLQGCLVCQGLDRSKIGTSSYNPADFYFSGEDIADSVRLSPMITFHFACFGAGTPKFDDFLPVDATLTGDGAPPPKDKWAPKPFVAYLPQRLLRGGALATVGHVDRAWSFTFNTERQDIETIEDTVTAIMNGGRVGHAMQVFAERYSELSEQLAKDKPALAMVATVQGRPVARGLPKAPPKLSARDAAVWTACRDARNYVILGDPAVRLPLAPLPPAP